MIHRLEIFQYVAGKFFQAFGFTVLPFVEDSGAGFVAEPLLAFTILIMSTTISTINTTRAKNPNA